MKEQIHSAQIVLPCANINRSLEFFTERLGFRVEMIFPADSPQTAVISGYGITLRLESSIENQAFTLNLIGDFSSLNENERKIYSPDGVRIVFVDEKTEIEIPEGKQEFVLTVLDDENSWSEGRAGMQYRDLIPSRLGGRFVASHIRIPKGGEVPDYVHYHKIRFQMIYCLSGWARLVYEDQGEPFLMRAGDCVLQPPEIRHRVLETSAGFEVVEIGCPAIHETFADHQMNLLNETFAPERLFSNQRFVHHTAENAVWKSGKIEELAYRDAGISEATNGLADVRVFRAITNAGFSVRHSGEFLFFFVLKGNLRLANDKNEFYSFKSSDSFVLPNDSGYFIKAEKGLEVLRVKLPAE